VPPLNPSVNDSFVDSASDEVRSQPGRPSGRHRRRRRRSPKVKSDIRAQIRVRIWLACTGALLVMAAALYLVLGHERSSESGLHLGSSPGSVAAAAPTASPEA
jgi:hypothetical protein